MCSSVSTTIMWHETDGISNCRRVDCLFNSALSWQQRKHQCSKLFSVISLPWRHNGHDSVSNHHSHDCLLNRLFRLTSKETSKLRVTGLCVGNSPGPVNSPHKGPVTRKMFPFDDVIMWRESTGHTGPVMRKAFPCHDITKVNKVNAASVNRDQLRDKTTHNFTAQDMLVSSYWVTTKTCVVRVQHLFTLCLMRLRHQSKTFSTFTI